jgi:hypothetical protein
MTRISLQLFFTFIDNKQALNFKGKDNVVSITDGKGALP